MASDVITLGRGLADLATTTSTTATLVKDTKTPQQVEMTIPRQAIRFTDLPVEIKTQIYSHAIRPDSHFHVSRYIVNTTDLRPHMNISNRLPAICFTNKLERAVSLLVFVRCTTVCFFEDTDAQDVMQMLEDCGYSEETSRAALRRVEIVYAGHLRPQGFWSDMEFLGMCPGLRELTLTIEASELRDQWDQWDHPTRLYAYVPLTCAEMVVKFDLSHIAKCVALRKLTFFTPKTYARTPRYGPGRLEAPYMSEVTHWLKREFVEKNGRDLEVVHERRVESSYPEE